MEGNQCETAKIIKHIFSDTTYSKAIRFRLSMQLAIMAEPLKEFGYVQKLPFHCREPENK